jgi:GDP-mannose 6-dehydrogenase
LLEAGHSVVGLDRDPAKRAAFAAGRSPVAEPELDALLAAGHAAGRLHVADTLEAWRHDLDLAMVCVGTPGSADGTLALDQPLAAIAELGRVLRRRRAAEPLLVVLRSTLPPGTTETRILPLLTELVGEPPGARYDVALNPEFLREGTALRDCRAPARIVIGERAPGVTGRLRGLHAAPTAPLFEVPFRVAETIKLVDNSFHALKVAFANEVGRLCLAHEIDPQAVMDLVLADRQLNLSAAYLRPGGPFGGPCLPKDLAATAALGRAQAVALPLLEAALASNRAHLAHLLAMIGGLVAPPGPLLQLGLSFKAGTDDLRGSPLVELALALRAAGYELRLVDPDLDGASAPRNGTAGPAADALRHLDADLDRAMAGAQLVILGKPLPALRARLPADLPVLDLTRLRAVRPPPDDGRA